MYILKLNNVAMVMLFLLTLSWGNFVSCEENNIKKHIVELGNRLNSILVEEKMCNKATNCLNKDFLFIESIPEGIGVTLYGMQNKATATKKIIKECNEMFFWLNRSVTIHVSAYEATKEQASQMDSKPYITLRFKEETPPTQEKKSEDDKKAEIYTSILNSIVGAVSDPKNQERFLDYISGGTLYSEEEKLERLKESQKHRLLAKEQEKIFKEQRKKLKQRIEFIFKEYQECNQLDSCQLISMDIGKDKSKSRIHLYIVTEKKIPSLVEKIIEECVDVFFKLERQRIVSCSFEDRRKEQCSMGLSEKCNHESKSYITLSLRLRGAE